MTAAGRHGIVTGTAELHQPISFRSALTLKWKSKNILLWEKGYGFVSTANERLWIHSSLTEIRFDWGRPPENSGYRYKELNLEKLQGR